MFTKIGKAGGGTGLEIKDPKFGFRIVKFKMPDKQLVELLNRLLDT